MQSPNFVQSAFLILQVQHDIDTDFYDILNTDGKSFFLLRKKMSFFCKFFSKNMALFLIRVFSNRNFGAIILEVSEYYLLVTI